MGVGMPEDILETVEHGIDMFDCVHPTRMARHGSFWNENGTFNLRNSSFRNEKTPPDPKCRCYTCVNFSTSYLRHLVIEQEITALRLLTIHNLAFLLHFMQEIRNAIQQKRFRQYKEEFLSKYYKK